MFRLQTVFSSDLKWIKGEWLLVKELEKSPDDRIFVFRLKFYLRDLNDVLYLNKNPMLYLYRLVFKNILILITSVISILTYFIFISIRL